MQYRLRHLTQADWMRHWKACESQTQLARRLGVTLKAVQYQLAKLRKKGVVFPPMEVSS